MNRFRFLLSLMLVLALVGGVGLLYRGAAACQALSAASAAFSKAARPSAFGQPTYTGLQWDPRLSATNGVNGLIRAIAVNGGDIYVAGSFTQAGGVLANNVARWNEQYNLWSPLGTGAANGVTGGASSGVNTLKISGNFV